MIIKMHLTKDLWLLQVNNLTLLEITREQAVLMKEAVKKGYKLSIGVEAVSSVELEDVKLLDEGEL